MEFDAMFDADLYTRFLSAYWLRIPDLKYVAAHYRELAVLSAAPTIARPSAASSTLTDAAVDYSENVLEKGD